MLAFLFVPQIQSLGHCSLLVLSQVDGAGLIYLRLGHRSWAGCCWGPHPVTSQGFPSPPLASGALQNHPWMPLFCLPLEWQLSLFSGSPIIISISADTSSDSQCKVWREELLLHSKKLHTLSSITVQSPFWWKLSFRISFIFPLAALFQFHGYTVL